MIGLDELIERATQGEGTIIYYKKDLHCVLIAIGQAIIRKRYSVTT